MTRCFCSIVCGALALGVSLLAQAPAAPRLVIVEPDADAVLVGPVVLRAALEPQSEIRRIDFFVDGTLVCRVERMPFDCEFNAGPDVKARLVRITATLASGDRLVQTVRTATLTIAEKTTADAVLVPVVVTDDDGKFAKGLTRDDFRVTEDGIPQRIAYFQSENVPLEIAIAIDISGSMGPTLPAVKTAIKRFLTRLKPIDRVTLVAFNDRAFVLSRREADPAVRIAAVDRLTASGGTALYDAVVTSLNLIGGPISRRALIVFTDGEDTRSLASPAPVEQRIRESDATVYVITHGTGAGADALRRQTGRLAEISGGRAFPVGRIEELERTFDFIHSEMESQYLIGYEPTNVKRDGTYRKVTVQVVKGRHAVRAREGYRAGSSR